MFRWWQRGRRQNEAWLTLFMFAAAGLLRRIEIDYAHLTREPGPEKALARVFRTVDSERKAKLRSAIVRGGISATLQAGLRDRRPAVRARSAILCGLLTIEELIPAVGPLLWDPQARVATSAARALGRMPGTTSADQLLSAVRSSRCSIGRLAIELARAAPAGYFQKAIALERHPRVQHALAVAAGLSSHAAVTDLRPLLSASRAEVRAAACHALGAGGRSAVAGLVVPLLKDQHPSVRTAAAKALGRNGDLTCGSELVLAGLDPDANVRASARAALRRLQAFGLREDAVVQARASRTASSARPSQLSPVAASAALSFLHSTEGGN